MHVTSHFVNIHFVNSHLVDVDKVGIDNVEIDEVGIDKVGRCQMIMLPTCIASNIPKASILVYVSEYKTCKIDQLEAWHPLFLWMLEHNCDINVFATSATDLAFKQKISPPPDKHPWYIAGLPPMGMRLAYSM